MSSPLTILITGAGGGLGKATATAFLAAGANVAVCDVNQERIDATTKEWTAAGHDDARILATTTSVTDPAAVQQLVADTVAKFGRLDVLVNNAGILDDFSGVAECSRDLWERVLAVNLHGPFHFSQAAIKQFESQTAGAPGGVIVNICSVASKYGYNAGAAYTASKHALLGLSRNTAFNYSDKGIYSIALLLGGMATNVGDGLMRGEVNQAGFERAQAVVAYDPQKHIVPLDNVAKYIVFLSDRSIARSANGSAVDFCNNQPAA